ncbi:MAG: BamA/TamA family outer membrane protein [Synergistaceae bacterium]|jgi:outer membrane protein insertion porin family|nr:BamA/TamA family outer membrane protein [Synergistaceae bacterium]
MHLTKDFQTRGKSVFRILTWFAVFALLLSSVPTAQAADSEVGGIPLVIGEQEPERKPIQEMDLSNVETPSADEPLSEGRPPSQERTERRQRLQGPTILSIGLEGNSEVVSDHILSVVTSQIGAPMDQNRLSRDADAIFEQGFYSNVDFRIEDEIDGVRVIFTVTENPIIDDINFFGNTIYSEDQLLDLCFTKPGMIFNRVFFRNDLQRLKDRYQQDGYVMARVSDVKIEGKVVNVYMVEPKIGEVVIQGNTRTKTYVIDRQIGIKAGDHFNATRLRYTLSKLQGLGYFEDVSVGFEPGDAPEIINLILTLAEAKTGKIGISIGYGTQSGFSGGISYSDNNWRGRGEHLGVGFELGDREQYWLTLEQPYMDPKVYAWRIGAYKRAWDDLSYYQEDVYQFDYDEDRKGGYIGAGRKFSERSKLSWYLTTEWQDIEIEPRGDALPSPQQLEEMQSGENFNVTGVLRRDNMDPYSVFPKGDNESIHVEKGLEALGGDWSYWKYWFEARYYTPLEFLTQLFERSFTVNDIPPIIAMRMMIGDADGYLPWAVDYTMGGDNTLRGYEDKRFRGDQMFLFNGEVRLPVHRTVSLVMFYDIGKVWDSNVGEGFDFGDMAKGYGLGVRVNTPLGNLRLDFAQGDDESRIHFGFGEMF